MQSPNLSCKTICRRTNNFGIAVFIMGKTYLLVIRDVNEAELWNCICGHYLEHPCSRALQPDKCLSFNKGNGFLTDAELTVYLLPPAKFETFTCFSYWYHLVILQSQHLNIWHRHVLTPFSGRPVQVWSQSMK